MARSVQDRVKEFERAVQARTEELDHDPAFLIETEALRRGLKKAHDRSPKVVDRFFKQHGMPTPFSLPQIRRSIRSIEDNEIRSLFRRYSAAAYNELTKLRTTSLTTSGLQDQRVQQGTDNSRRFATRPEYIHSQRGLGWKLVPTRYDDGGFSGGTLDRPALQQLLTDIDAGLVDCVVVYKVDRPSRSLLDFARIMERFERQNVSFVSITQQFNTTTSLGRLTLNILFSFAQFEREIIGCWMNARKLRVASSLSIS